MANELTTIEDVLLVWRDPTDARYVRAITGASAGTWVLLSGATFSECTSTVAQVGTTGVYVGDLPSGLNAGTTYAVLTYRSTATDFDDAGKSEAMYETTAESQATVLQYAAADIAEDATNALRFRLPTAGLTATDIKLRKFGGAYSESLTRDLTPIGNGEYDLVAIAGDRDTAGENRWMLTMSDGSVWVVVEMVQANALDEIADAVDDKLSPRFAEIQERQARSVIVGSATINAQYDVPGKTLYSIRRRGDLAALASNGATDTYVDTDEARGQFAFDFTDYGGGHHEADLSDLSYGVWTDMVYARNDNDEPSINDDLVGSAVYRWNGATDGDAGNMAVSVTNATTSAAVPGVQVIATQAGTTFSSIATTKTNGVASFSLKNGTYTFSVYSYLWRGQSADATLPGTTSRALSVTAVGPVSASADPDFTLAWGYTRDGQLKIKGGVTIKFALVTPGDPTLKDSVSLKNFEITSDENGLIEVELPVNSIYRARRNDGKWVDFTTDSAGLYHLPFLSDEKGS